MSDRAGVLGASSFREMGEAIADKAISAEGMTSQLYWKRSRKIVRS